MSGNRKTLPEFKTLKGLVLIFFGKITPKGRVCALS